MIMCNYYVISLCLIAVSSGFFVFMFEKRKPMAREIVLLAVMISLAVIGRTIFFMTPQFKPMAAIVIITGVAFGKESGFLCGAISAFVSNIFFGQGPWTPWQMFAFGVLGFLAGVIFHRRLLEKKLGRSDVVALCIYGGLATFFMYGIIMDTATVLMSTQTPSVPVFLAAYASGIVFNAIHGVSTIIFLAVFSSEMLKKINRIQIKFGMFQNRR